MQSYRVTAGIDDQGNRPRAHQLRATRPQLPNSTLR